MSRLVRRVALLLLTLLSVGCGVNHELDLSKINSLKYANEGDAGLPQPLPLAIHSKEFASLVEWLEQNRSGWEPLEATILPGGLSIYGDGFDLRVVHQTAVLRYRDESGEYRLLHKKVPTDKFAFLMEQ
jgi:hypothetical protein